MYYSLVAAFHKWKTCTQQMAANTKQDRSKCKGWTHYCAAGKWNVSPIISLLCFGEVKDTQLKNRHHAVRIMTIPEQPGRQPPYSMLSQWRSRSRIWRCSLVSRPGCHLQASHRQLLPSTFPKWMPAAPATPKKKKVPHTWHYNLQIRKAA